MIHRRPPFVRYLTIGMLAGACVLSYAGVVLAGPSLWECNFCHQQYQGDSLPPALRFAKCPAKDMKQNHFWSKKG